MCSSAELNIGQRLTARANGPWGAKVEVGRPADATGGKGS